MSRWRLLAVILILVSVACTSAPTRPSATPTASSAGASAGSTGLSDVAPPLPTEATLALAAPSPTVQQRQSADPTAIVVFASSPFGGAMSELGSAFMLSNHDATGVSYRFDNAALLAQMIQQGTDADVFASMDPAQMDSLRNANLLDAAPSVLVRDRLVIVVSKSNPQGIQSFKDLANPGIRFIIAAPGTPTTAAISATFNRASQDPSYGADFASRVDRNVLARDGDDRFVVSRIVAGEVNAGLVYASSVDAHSHDQVQIIDVPDALNAVVEYPIAVLKNGTNINGGRAFLNYALSAPAQDVFSRWGFTRAASNSP